VNLFDVKFVDVILLVFADAHEFLAVLGAPGRNVLQGPVIVGENLQNLPLMQISQELSGLQQVHGTDPVYQVGSGVGFAVMEEFHGHNLFKYLLIIY
jgi:hypothetical protein